MFEWMQWLFARVPRGEGQTCPYRREHGHRQIERQDVWATNRWRYDPGANGRMWMLKWVPRTCSYCGSVHPEDAIRLLKEHNFEVEAIDNARKRYLRPPGFHLLDTASYRKLSHEEDVMRDAYWEPKPCAKLYVPHMNIAQVVRFNHALAENSLYRRSLRPDA